MTLRRTICNCKCQGDPFGVCSDYTNCPTELQLSYAFPSFTATSRWNSTVNTTANVSAYSGSMKIFTHDQCISNTCGYAGVITDKCVESQTCLTDAGFTQPTNSAVACMHGDVYEDIYGSTEIPQPNTFFTPPPNRFWNNCDCFNEALGSGFYSLEIKPAYLRHETRTENYWCQCSFDCGNASADYRGGDCSDCYSGYKRVDYRGTTGRITFSRLIYTTPDSCYSNLGEFYGLRMHDLEPNRWYLLVGMRLITTSASRQRNCSGNWGTTVYWVTCPSQTQDDCTTCIENNRENSWDDASYKSGNPDPLSGCSYDYSGSHYASIWSLPSSIQDCKDLAGVTSTTDGVTLAHQYCPYTSFGLSGRLVAFDVCATYASSGFECSSWSIGQA